MLRLDVTLLVAVVGAFTVSANAQPDTGANGEPESPGSEASQASSSTASLDEALAAKVWRLVLPDVLEPLPAPGVPAQRNAVIAQSEELIVRAMRPDERNRDADLRALHESIADDERQALQAYVDVGTVELAQLRRQTIENAVCRGRGRTGADLAAAHVRADVLHARRMLALVQGLTSVLDADSFDRVIARGMSRDARSDGLSIIGNVATSRSARFVTLSQEEARAELNSTCRGVWSYHSDAQRA